MHARAKAFWVKSVENRRVSEDACRQGYCNAAASRYYYGLRLAVQALFEERDIPVPLVTTRDGTTKRMWGHRRLIRKAGTELSQRGLDTEKWLNDAIELRERADYEELPVEPDELDSLKKDSGKLFKEIWDEIR